GAELISLGVNLDLAPVADIWNNPDNEVISDRSFGSDPQMVAEFTRQMVIGMSEQGLGTTLKHFPGHGNTFEDSHTAFAYNYSTLEQLQSSELIPFIAGIEAGCDAVMTAHVMLPNIQEEEKPATVCYTITTELLRESLGFDGLIITDSMHMKGMTNYAPIADASVMAINAGADLLLIDEEYAYDVYDALLLAVKDGTITGDRLDESVRRILEFKIEHHLFDPDYVLPDPSDVLGCAEHLAIVEQIISFSEITNE
ncbi:MAG: glycoside hydrolase family 3 N-terminal domain-containing protein, partial [Eubacteriales bacterium]|nr:glycoside hydrolase family 3 N-terminal domain-containing protein [Eubacteriales bacterium]